MSDVSLDLSQQLFPPVPPRAPVPSSSSEVSTDTFQRELSQARDRSNDRRREAPTVESRPAGNSEPTAAQQANQPRDQDRVEVSEERHATSETKAESIGDAEEQSADEELEKAGDETIEVENLIAVTVSPIIVPAQAARNLALTGTAAGPAFAELKLPRAEKPVFTVETPATDAESPAVEGIELRIKKPILLAGESLPQTTAEQTSGDVAAVVNPIDQLAAELTPVSPTEATDPALIEQVKQATAGKTEIVAEQSVQVKQQAVIDEQPVVYAPPIIEPEKPIAIEQQLDEQPTREKVEARSTVNTESPVAGNLASPTIAVSATEGLFRRDSDGRNSDAEKRPVFQPINDAAERAPAWQVGGRETVETPVNNTGTLNRVPGTLTAGNQHSRNDGLSEIDRVRFVQRVARAVQSAVDREGEIRLKLSPPELGSLKLELSLRDGALTARLETETAAARALLIDNLPQLRERLAEQNVRIERFDVDVRDQTGGNNARDQAEQAREQAAKQAAKQANRLPREAGDTPVLSAPITRSTRLGAKNSQLNLII